MIRITIFLFLSAIYAYAQTIMTAEEAIEKLAGDLNPYLVIIGLSAGRRLFGATSDWILNNIHHDVLVIQS